MFLLFGPKAWWLLVVTKPWPDLKHLTEQLGNHGNVDP